MTVPVLILVLLALAAYWRFVQTRKEQLWAGFLLLPLVIPAVLLRTTPLLDSREGLLWFARSLSGLMALGMLAGALYAQFVHPRLTPYLNPARQQLRILFLVPLAVLALVTTGTASFSVAVLGGIALGAVLVLLLWRPLAWDILYAALGMAGLYTLGQVLFLHVMPGELTLVWFERLSGINWLNQPVEQLLSAALYGVLWGPVYVAFKPLHLRGESEPKVSTTKRLVVQGGLLAVAVLLGAGAHLMTTPPAVLAAGGVGPDGALQEQVDLAGEVEIAFSHPVDRQRIQLAVTPPVEGSWQFEDPVVGSHFYRKATFVPERSFKPGQEYTVTAENIANVYGNEESSYQFNVVTKELPRVASTVPREGQTGVAICDQLRVTLDQPRAERVQFAFALSPERPVQVSEDGEDSYLITPEGCLEQNTAYTLRVTRSVWLEGEGDALLVQEPEELTPLTFTTKPAPGISAHTPSGDQEVPRLLSTLSVTFSEEMKQDDPLPYLSLSPALAGSWQWVSGKELRLTMGETPALATRYTVTFKKGMPALSGGFLQEDATVGFTTIGPVKVARTVPGNGVGGVGTDTMVSVTFDQAVDQASAEAAWSISPSIPGSFSWSGNTLSFKGELQKDTEYRVTLAEGIKGIEGLPGGAYSFRFVTEESVVLLSVPMDYQDKALSCEVASLKMALAYRGISVSEDALMDHIGYDPTPRNGNVWGDPDSAFVGSITGRQNTTGYGVHWGPVASAANHYRPAAAFRGWTAQQLAEALAAGNPVVMWGIYPGGYYDPWVTPGGRTIEAWKGEHVRTVTGFVGSVSNPKAFYTNDPVAGKQKWTLAKFLANWATYGNSGVVVY